jgi:hypothetical protein
MCVVAVARCLLLKSRCARFALQDWLEMNIVLTLLVRLDACISTRQQVEPGGLCMNSSAVDAASGSGSGGSSSCRPAAVEPVANAPLAGDVVAGTGEPAVLMMCGVLAGGAASAAASVRQPCCAAVPSLRLLISFHARAQHRFVCCNKLSSSSSSDGVLPRRITAERCLTDVLPQGATYDWKSPAGR